MFALYELRMVALTGLLLGVLTALPHREWPSEMNVILQDQCFLAGHRPPMENADGRWNGVHYVDGDTVIDGQRMSDIVGARLWGRVYVQDTDEPVAGVTVRAEIDRPWEVNEPILAITGEDGFYYFSNIPPAEYWLHFPTPCIAPVNFNLGVSIHEGAGRRVDIPVTGNAVIEAQVIDMDTRLPLAGAEITLCSDKSLGGSCLAPTTRTDRQGHFRCVGMEAATYALFVDKNIGELDHQSLQPEPSSVTLRPGQVCTLAIAVRPYPQPDPPTNP